MKIKILFLLIVIFLFLIPQSKGQMVWNQACDFGYITIPQSPTLEITGSFTIEAWINPENTTYGSIFGNLGTEYGLYLASDKLYFYTNQETRLRSKSNIPVNQWTHIAGSYDSSTNVFAIIINGLEDTSCTIPSADPVKSNFNILIGACPGPPCQGQYLGLMDEVRLWESGLTSYEVGQNMRTSLGTNSGNYSKLVLSLTFQDANPSGTIFSLNDWSGNNNNGSGNLVSAFDMSDVPSNTISINECVTLDGTGDYLAGPDHSNVSPTAGITVEMWLYPQSFDANVNTLSTVINKGNNANSVIDYRMDVNLTKLNFFVNETNIFAYTSFDELFPLNRWTNVAFTYDGLTGSISLIINGDIEALDTNLVGYIHDNSDSIFIGGTLSTECFEGLIDEVRITCDDLSYGTLLNRVFTSVNESNDAHVPNVAYNLDGGLFSNSDESPRLYFRNGAMFVHNAFTADAPISPLTNSPNFQNDYYISNPNFRIPNSGTNGLMITDTINITGSASISDVNVFVGLNHTDEDNLTVSLISPTGTSVTLYSTTSLIDNSDNIITIFDDQADSSIITQRYVTFTPKIQPLIGLNSSLTGQSTSGKWKLQITDGIAGDTGILYGWGIQFNNVPTNNRALVSGAITGNGYYQSLVDAIAAINSGSQTQANITIYVQQDIIETQSVILNNGTWASLKIEPVGTRSITGAMTQGTSLIDLNGANNVTIDGLNTGGNSLTISNTTVSTNANTSTIRFQGDASNNVITNCTVLGSSNSAVGIVAGTILFGSSAVTTGNDGNTISNCAIGPAGSNLPSKAIYFGGTTTNSTLNNSGNVVTGCNIHDYFSSTTTSSGIYVKNGSTSTTIQNNKFYQTAPRVHATNSLHTAIKIDNTSGNDFQILGNIIGFANPSGTGTYSISGASNDFRAIDLNVGTTTATSVQGNIISGINHVTTSNGITAASPCMMISIDGGLVNVGNIMGNTIGSMTSTGSISFTSSHTGIAGINCIANFGASSMNCSNNMIGGITAINSSTGASNVYGIVDHTNSASTFICANNTVGGTDTNSIQSISTNPASAVNGIWCLDAAGNITNNIVRNVEASGGTGSNYTASVIGIRVRSASAAQIISQNTIYNLKNTNTATSSTLTGIYNEGNNGVVYTIARNLVHSITVPWVPGNTVSHTIHGIDLSNGTAAVQNNMVRLGVDGQGNSVNSPVIIGINDDGTFNNINFNTVYIGGTAEDGTSNTFAFFSSVGGNARTYRNNIFVNSRKNDSSTGKHYAIRVEGINPDPVGLTIGNNVYRVTGNGGVLGRYNNTDKLNLQQWELGLPRDSTSFEANPRLQNPDGDITSLDLHINPALPSVAEVKGIIIPEVIDDFDGQVRALNTPVDLGADAGNNTPAVTVLTIKVFIEGFYNDLTNSQVEDTVTIETRETVSPYTIHDSTVVELDTNGTASILGDGAKTNFFAVVRHRNSIETWSNPFLIRSYDSTAYDFTIAASQAYGDNQVQVDNSPVAFAMFGGDITGDGVIDASDALMVENDAYNFTTGYVVTDLNGDGIVDGSDLTIADNNAANFVSAVVP